MIQSIYYANFDLKVRKILLEAERKFVAVTLGEGSYIVGASLEYGSSKCHVIVGRYCSIAHGIKFIIGLNHDIGTVSTYPFEAVFEQNNHIKRKCQERQQIIIGNDVWVGAYATILGGVRIGNGAVVGAGAVVAKDVPPYAVVVGNPARIIRYRFDQDTIDWLQQLRWWNWTPARIQQRMTDFDDLIAFRKKYAAEIRDFVDGEFCGDLCQVLARFGQEGYIFYYFQPDVLSKEAVWKEVFKKFTDGRSKGLKKILFVDIHQDVPAHIKSKFVKLVSTYNTGQIVLNDPVDCYDVRSVLPFMDFIITTKEAEVSTVVDLASSCKCEVVYGFDDFL